jgi:hypothetical protein
MSQVILRLSLDSNAIGPFSLYTGSTSTEPILTGQTRDQLVAGVVVNLDAAVTGTTYTLIFQNNQPGCDQNTVSKQITVYGTDTTPTPTPTQTPTPSVTPNLSPSATATNTPTPTHTPTPSPTSGTSSNNIAYLFIEPQNNSSDIGGYMYNNYSAFTEFFGFTNLSAPDFSDQPQFEIDMNYYIEYSGWTDSTLPNVRTQAVPQSSGGIDSFGNTIVEFNFTTHEVPAGTVNGSAWYTWIIPTTAINGGIQTIIDLNVNGNANTFTQIFTDYSLYQHEFEYTGSTIPSGTYRVYSSFVDPAFYIANSQNIYFKGGEVT